MGFNREKFIEDYNKLLDEKQQEALKKEQFIKEYNTIAQNTNTNFNEEKFLKDYTELHNKSKQGQAQSASVTVNSGFDREKFIADYTKLWNEKRAAEEKAAAQQYANQRRAQLQQQNYEQMQETFNNEPEKKGFTDKLQAFLAGIGVLDKITATGDTIGNMAIANTRERVAYQKALDNLKMPTKEEGATYEDIRNHIKETGEIQSKLLWSTPFDETFAEATKNHDVTQLSETTKNLKKKTTEAREDFTEGMGEAGKFMADVAWASADMAEYALLSKLTGVPMTILMGVAAGAEAGQDALYKGYDADKAGLMAGGAGLITSQVEKLGGIAGSKLGTKAAAKLISKLPSGAVQYLSGLSTSKLGQILGNAGAEALEEGAEYDLQRVWKNLVLDEDTPRDVKEQLYSMAVGGAVGGVFGTLQSNTQQETADIEKENNTENAQVSEEQENKPQKTPERIALERQMLEIVGIDTRTEVEKVTEEQQQKVDIVKNLVEKGIAPAEHLEQAHQSALKKIQEAKNRQVETVKVTPRPQNRKVLETQTTAKICDGVDQMFKKHVTTTEEKVKDYSLEVVEEIKHNGVLNEQQVDALYSKAAKTIGRPLTVKAKQQYKALIDKSTMEMKDISKYDDASGRQKRQQYNHY